MFSIIIVCSAPGISKDCGCYVCRLWHAERALKLTRDRLEEIVGDSYTVNAEDVREVVELLTHAMEHLEELKRRHEKGGTDAGSETKE